MHQKRAGHDDHPPTANARSGAPVTWAGELSPTSPQSHSSASDTSAGSRPGARFHAWLGSALARATQQGDILNLVAHERTRTVDEGGYIWTGELRLWDNEALIGWYRASEGAIRSKGSMYFALHAQGQHAIGRWVGLSYDSELETGFAVLAGSEELLTEHVARLQAEDD